MAGSTKIITFTNQNSNIHNDIFWWSQASLTSCNEELKFENMLKWNYKEERRKGEKEAKNTKWLLLTCKPHVKEDHYFHKDIFIIISIVYK